MTSDDRFQQEHLDATARTFALTLKPLPLGLRPAVMNLYLLARIADTIEDDPGIEDRDSFGERFIAAVEGAGDPESFAEDLAPHVTKGAERKLVAETPRALAITRRLDPDSRAAMERCIRIMIGGMLEFARIRGPAGLADHDQLERYCYYVAGVVGETLTELYCAYSPRTAERRKELERHARAFGQGLQMVNVLKDIEADRKRGVSWMPRDVARRKPGSPRYVSAVRRLVGIARAKLRQGLAYCLAIPRSETGIRRSCLWPLALAMLTLREVQKNPGAPAKISRRKVWAVVLAMGLFARSDRGVRLVFRLCS